MSRRFELIGGHVVLDLVNTVSWRLDPVRWVDRLETSADLADWCDAVGLRGPAADLGRVRSVRETIYHALRPIAAGAQPTAAEWSDLRRLVVRALRTATPAGPRLLDWPPADLPGTLALGAAGLLEREDLSRLRECSDDDCGWLFLDRSRNGSRRWCSSADCGNRARARRHYQRLHLGRVGDR